MEELKPFRCLHFPECSAVLDRSSLNILYVDYWIYLYWWSVYHDLLSSLRKEVNWMVEKVKVWEVKTETKFDVNENGRYYKRKGRDKKFGKCKREKKKRGDAEMFKDVEGSWKMQSLNGSSREVVKDGSKEKVKIWRSEGSRKCATALNNEFLLALFAVWRKLSTDLLFFFVCLFFSVPSSPFSAAVSFQADSRQESLNTQKGFRDHKSKEHCETELTKEGVEKKTERGRRTDDKKRKWICICCDEEKRKWQLEYEREEKF